MEALQGLEAPQSRGFSGGWSVGFRLHDHQRHGASLPGQSGETQEPAGFA